MHKLLFLLLSVIVFQKITAQQIHDHIPETENMAIRHQAYSYHAKLPALKTWLQERGQEANRNTAADHVTFRWPMRSNSNYDDIPGYYVITNYMDQNRDTHYSATDWRCYSLNYSGHEGNDYSLFPFFWRMKEQSNVLATAGAAGIVIAVRDSVENDNNCNMANQNTTANYVAVLNADSSIARYLHVKTGSAKVTLGQFVQAGQPLAVIASSGRSSNPHLHFDLQYFREDNGDYDFIEPYFDNSMCNKRTSTTWWQNQKTYIEPKLNRVMTHYGIPALFGDINHTRNQDFCAEAEDAKPKAKFEAGDLLVVGVGLTHVNKRDSVSVRIIYPNGVQWVSNQRSVPDERDGVSVNFRSTYYMTFNYILPAAAASGTYTIITDFTYRPFDNVSPYNPITTPITKTYYEYFTVGCTGSQTLSGTFPSPKGYIVSNNIQSTQTIAHDMRYQAGSYVQLNPGFTAPAGTNFKARIRDCGHSD